MRAVDAHPTGTPPSGKNAVRHGRYSWWDFVPRVVGGQFKKGLNLYFLGVVGLQMIPAIAPVAAWSTAAPLAIAVIATAAREGADDLRRHARDRRHNERPVEVHREMGWRVVRCADVAPGDVVRVRRNEEVPCDGVCIWVKGGGTTVKIRTEELDGEIDGKVREVVGSGGSSGGGSDETVAAITGMKLWCPPPSHVLDSFDARLESADGGTRIALSHGHLLYQSSRLISEEAVIVAVYTGMETKSSLSQRSPQEKWSQLDQQISKYSLRLFLLQLVVSVALGVAGYATNTSGNLPWYFRPSADASLLVYIMRFFLLMTVMIPISYRFVSDMAKAYAGVFLEWDRTLTDPQTGTPLKAINTSVIDDLGRISHVLCDKTGTLTTNQLRLVAIVVDGVTTWGGDEGRWKCAAVTGILSAVSLCSAVEVSAEETTDGVPLYEGTSSDEVALCDGAARLGGVKLVRRERDEAVISRDGRQVVHRVWLTFPFSSVTKSMGVLVSDSSVPDRVHLIVKGADDQVRLMLEPSVQAETDRVMTVCDTLASKGLRVLIIAHKTISLAEAQEIQQAFETAQLDVNDRSAQVEALRLRVCRGLSIMGATAVEDNLQPLVNRTISDLIDGGLRVWMLTGDKVETAVQVAIAAGLVLPTDPRVTIAGSDWESVLRRTLPSHVHGGTLVLEGGSVADAVFRSPEQRAWFVNAVSGCKSVVGARFSPAQKAAVAEIVVKAGHTVLAVGDGANDVAMIQTANVGVGIVGGEGQQAARAADFACTLFSHLSPLLIVHGHRCYRRQVTMMQYCYYKSMLISFAQLYYNAVWARYSGVSFWDALSLTAWNGWYTLIPCLLLVFDRCAPRRTLEENPFLYRWCQRGTALTMSKFIGNIAWGAFQSAAAVAATCAYVEAYTAVDGYTETHALAFTLAYCVLILLQVGEVVLRSSSITPINGVGIVVMPIVYTLLTKLYASYSPSSSYYGVARHHLFVAGNTAAVGVMTLGLLLPHVIFVAVKEYWFPDGVSLMRGVDVERMTTRQWRGVISNQRGGATLRSVVDKLTLLGRLALALFVSWESPSELEGLLYNQGATSPVV